MRRLGLLLIAVLAGLASLAFPREVAAAQWGSSYGDPWGFCPSQSLLPSSYTSVVTNDPSVPNNPEQDTFWGIHQYPGYDDWYGYWYGDFAGMPGDDSGWHYIGTSWYGAAPLHWNFGSFGWQVHGHAKQYIAYYNWTFGGECGLGSYGSINTPPYMADVYGNPVVDIYVDSVPPNPPVPRATTVTTSAITFTWDPVTDRGDGAGQDLYTSGMANYDSWISVGGTVQQSATTTGTRAVTASALAVGQPACLNVRARDNLGNTTPVQQACATVIRPPSPPPLPAPPTAQVNPTPRALVGLPSWFWLAPAPAGVSSTFTSGGFTYRVDQAPSDVSWSFGDGAVADVAMPGGAGLAYPQTSPVAHAYEHHSTGVTVSATVNWTVTWWALSGGSWLGPYSLPPRAQPVAPVTYPVEQAQAELTG